MSHQKVWHKSVACCSGKFSASQGFCATLLKWRYPALTLVRKVKCRKCKCALVLRHATRVCHSSHMTPNTGPLSLSLLWCSFMHFLKVVAFLDKVHLPGNVAFQSTPCPLRARSTILATSPGLELLLDEDQTSTPSSDTRTPYLGFLSATRSRMQVLTKENLVRANTAPAAISSTFTTLVGRIRFP